MCGCIVIPACHYSGFVGRGLLKCHLNGHGSDQVVRMLPCISVLRFGVPDSIGRYRLLEPSICSGDKFPMCAGILVKLPFSAFFERNWLFGVNGTGCTNSPSTRIQDNIWPGRNRIVNLNLRKKEQPTLWVYYRWSASCEPLRTMFWDQKGRVQPENLDIGCPISELNLS